MKGSGMNWRSLPASCWWTPAPVPREPETQEPAQLLQGRALKAPLGGLVLRPRGRAPLDQLAVDPVQVRRQEVEGDAVLVG